MMVAYVDANVILRFLVGDPPEMAAKAIALMQAVEDGRVRLRVDEITVAEVVWVLGSFYKHEPADIASTLVEFLSQEGIETQDAIFTALVLYGSKGIDFSDALLVVHMQQQGVYQVFSFDQHFERVPALQRLEPGAA